MYPDSYRDTSKHSAVMQLLLRIPKNFVFFTMVSVHLF